MTFFARRSLLDTHLLVSIPSIGYFPFAGIFPEPDKDPVIQIANMVVYQGEKNPFIRNVFTVNTCAPVVGSKVYSYDKESELLKVTQLLLHFAFQVVGGHYVGLLDIWLTWL